MNLSNLRVLFVGTHLSKTRGIKSVSEELVERFDKSGHCALATSSHESRVLRLADMLATVWRRQADYDIGHVDLFGGRAFTWGELVIRALKALGKPVVTTLHGGGLPRLAANHGRRVGKVLRAADIVVAPSNYLAEQMQPFVQHGIEVLPNAVDVGRYEFRVRHTAAPRLLWLRAFDSTYAPWLAPMVLSELRRRGLDATLTMIGHDKGDGSLQRTQAMARQHSVEEFVQILPGIPNREVPSWLRQFDIFLNTTTVDNNPVSLLEAAACGLCIVTTSVGGIPWIYNNGENALFFASGNAAEAATHIERLTTDSALAARLSTAGRALAESYDWSVILPQWEQLFQGLTVAQRQRCAS